MNKKNGAGKAIIKTLRVHSVLFAFTLISVAVSAGISVVPSLVLGNIIDSLSEGLSPKRELVILYFILILVDALLSSGKESLLVILGEKMTHSLRSMMAEKLSRLEADTLLGSNPGETAALFSSDVDTLEKLFSSGVLSMLSDVCRIISILSVIAVKNTGLFLILLVILPVFAVFTRLTQKRRLSAELDNRRAVAKVSGEVPETVHNIRTIHNLSLEDYMEKRYTESVRRSYRAMEKSNFYDAGYPIVVSLLQAAVVAAVMLLSSSGNTSILTFFGMSVGTSVTVMSCISNIFTPISSLGMEAEQIVSALAGIRRIDSFLSLEERNIPRDDGTTPTGGITLESATFAYRESPVLKNFSLDVKKGEQVLITGRTGAGKSTLFKLLLGLYKPLSGRVTVMGRDAYMIPDSKRRRIISCVEQMFRAVPGTVLDQITLRDPGITEKMAREALRLTGLEERVRSFKDGLYTEYSESLFSEGERELLSISRAVVSDPKILLLDEITANLDSGTEEMVLEALDKASEGRTVISISHRLYRSYGIRSVEIK